MEQSYTKKLYASAAAAVALAVAAPLSAQSPEAAYNGEWLSVSGTVESVTDENFMLDYGPGAVMVEMDDFDWYADNPVVIGDQVTVTGRMDDDFFQSRRIEAGSLYVDSLHSYFFANAADEEAVTVPTIDFAAMRDGGVSLTGVVQAIGDDNVTLDTGLLDYQVDTSSLTYDPFDMAGFHDVQVGDRVLVRGEFDDADLFDSREIDAKMVIELSA